MVSARSERFEQKYDEFLQEVDLWFTESEKELVKGQLETDNPDVSMLVGLIRNGAYYHSMMHRRFSNARILAETGKTREQLQARVDGACRVVDLWIDVWQEVALAGYPMEVASLKTLLREIRP